MQEFNLRSKADQSQLSLTHNINKNKKAKWKSWNKKSVGRVSVNTVCWYKPIRIEREHSCICMETKINAPIIQCN